MNIDMVQFDLGEVYLEPCQISKIEFFVKIVNEWKSLLVFAKGFVLHVWQGSEYASDWFGYSAVTSRCKLYSTKFVWSFSSFNLRR